MSVHSDLRIGLVGAGKMAEHHARAIMRIAGSQLAAVVDSDSSARSRMLQIAPQAAAYAKLEDLLGAEQVDVLHICTPPSTHEALARVGLGAGCHIYVEKPFVATSAVARGILSLAESKGLKVCAGHQLLYEAPARRALQLLPALGTLVHIESYFSFRTVRRSPGGRAPLRPDLQLLDILPHPVYLLLEFLHQTPGETEIAALQVGQSGTVHALIRRGDLTGNLTVTLEGRPVESYLRLVGLNGSLTADFVRGTVQRHIGPGTSGIDKLFAPYRQAWQTLGGTTGAMIRRVANRQRSYPGLRELFEAFYASVRSGTASPISPGSIEATVKICERVGEQLGAQVTSRPEPRTIREDAPLAILTGGTGFLGKRVAERLVETGWRVRVLARRRPARWEEVSGVEYAVADLAGQLDLELFAGARIVIHAAAETAGGWEDHERNSIKATELVIRAAAAARVPSFLHVSSLAVLHKPVFAAITEETPLASDSRKLGPYVWGKLESERGAIALGTELGMKLKVVRPGAIVDYTNFEAPGRLGKRLGNWFVAVGSPRHRLNVVDLTFAAEAFVWLANHFENAPDKLNLLAPVLPSKRELLNELRKMNPDLTTVWLPTVVLHPLSWLAIVAQKVLRPGKPAANVAKVFSVQRYDTGRIAALAPQIAEQGSPPSAPQQPRTRPMASAVE